jgi:hypothetical protein
LPRQRPSNARISQVNQGRQLNRPSRTETASAFYRFWHHRFGLLILIAVSLVSVFSILGLSSNAKVLPLNSGGTATFLHQPQVYQAAASHYLAESIWNGNKITVNIGKLRSQMKTKFPELADVSVTLPLIGHRPIVYLVVAEPAVIINGATGSYVVDTNGRAVADSSEVNGLSDHHLPTIIDQSGFRARKGGQVLTPGDVSFIQTVVAQLAARKFNVSNMTLPPATRELDVQLSGQPYTVKFNLHDTMTARQQAGTFLATQAQLQKQHIVPASYIDVRVDGRAYYK